MGFTNSPNFKTSLHKEEASRDLKRFLQPTRFSLALSFFSFSKYCRFQIDKHLVKDVVCSTGFREAIEQRKKIGLSRIPEGLGQKGWTSPEHNPSKRALVLNLEGLGMVNSDENH